MMVVNITTPYYPPMMETVSVELLSQLLSESNNGVGGYVPDPSDGGMIRNIVYE